MEGVSPPPTVFVSYPVFEVISSESLSAIPETIVSGSVCLIILLNDSSSEERSAIEVICSSIHLATPSAIVVLFVMYFRGRGSILTEMNPSLVKRFNRS